MAFVKILARTHDRPAEFKCLSADTRGGLDEVAGDICRVDNGDIDCYTGTQWINIVKGGASLSEVKTDLTHPGLLSDSASVTLDASGDGADLIVTRTTPNSDIAFVISGLTSETVTIKSYVDEGQTIETAACLPTSLATNANAASTALGNGSYVLRDVPGFFWHFEKSATTETPVITYTSAI